MTRAYNEDEMLRQLAQDLWVAERPQRAFGIEMGTRMTVVRLADGTLFVHSPVALDRATRLALDALGPVRHVVAPNRFHHLHAGVYPVVYLDARFYAAPGVGEKRPDLPIDEVLGDTAPSVWAGQIDQTLFRGMPLTNEIVFLHRTTRTLVLTDIATNVRAAPGLDTWLLFSVNGTYGRFAAGWIERLLTRDWGAARASLEHVLAWDFDRIIVAHGDVVDHGGPAALRTAFHWLLSAHC